MSFHIIPGVYFNDLQHFMWSMCCRELQLLSHLNWSKVTKSGFRLPLLHAVLTVYASPQSIVNSQAQEPGGSGGTCPHNQSHPVCAILGLAMIYHLKFMNRKATKYALLVSSSLELRVLCVSPRLLKVTASIVQKWAWSKNFMCTTRTVSYAPQP